jgi:hypothetical protein
MKVPPNSLKVLEVTAFSSFFSQTRVLGDEVSWRLGQQSVGFCGSNEHPPSREERVTAFSAALGMQLPAAVM